MSALIDAALQALSHHLESEDQKYAQRREQRRAGLERALTAAFGDVAKQADYLPTKNRSDVYAVIDGVTFEQSVLDGRALLATIICQHDGCTAAVDRRLVADLVALGVMITHNLDADGRLLCLMHSSS